MQDNATVNVKENNRTSCFMNMRVLEVGFFSSVKWTLYIDMDFEPSIIWLLFSCCKENYVGILFL